MFKAMNPEGVCPPFRHYVHSIEVPPNARWLVVAGQVGTLPDGTIPDGIEAQDRGRRGATSSRSSKPTGWGSRTS